MLKWKTESDDIFVLEFDRTISPDDEKRAIAWAKKHGLKFIAKRLKKSALTACTEIIFQKIK